MHNAQFLDVLSVVHHSLEGNTTKQEYKQILFGVFFFLV